MLARTLCFDPKRTEKRNKIRKQTVFLERELVILWPLNLARKNCNHLKKGPQLPFAAAAMMIRRQKAKFSKSQVRSLRVI